MLTALQGHFTKISSKIRKLQRERERSVSTAASTAGQTRAVRRRRRAAAADRMSASPRRRFRDVFTSCCTPAT